MNYNKLKSLIEKQNLSIAKACRMIGRTDAWFHKAIVKESMTIRDLEKILALCKSSLSEFFAGEKPTIDIVNEPQAGNGNNVYKELAEERKKIIKIRLSKPALELLCSGEGLVFAPMAEQTVNKYLKKILPYCGINKRLRFHSARHTFATMFLHLGGKVEVLQQLLGHEDIRYTMIYVHVSDADKETQMRAFDKF